MSQPFSHDVFTFSLLKDQMVINNSGYEFTYPASEYQRMIDLITIGQKLALQEYLPPMVKDNDLTLEFSPDMEPVLRVNDHNLLPYAFSESESLKDGIKRLHGEYLAWVASLGRKFIQPKFPEPL